MDVCDIFHQVAVERAVRDAITDTKTNNRENYVFACESGAVGTAKGNETQIDGDTLETAYSICEDKMLLDFHTHPKGDTIPSPNDLISDAFHKPKFSCIYGTATNAIECFKTKGELAELGDKAKKLYDELDIYTESKRFFEKYEQYFPYDVKKKILDDYNSIKNNYLNIIERMNNIIKNKFGSGIVYPVHLLTPNDTVDIYQPDCSLDNILPGLVTAQGR